jgi:hypothetical protein
MQKGQQKAKKGFARRKFDVQREVEKISSSEGKGEYIWFSAA